MELELIRTYFPNGTNGELLHESKRVCFTIELPWRKNEPGVSCIPEDRYELTERKSAKYGKHLLVNGVAKRSLILIHPANDAAKELKGCIAPVSILQAEGKGLRSRVAKDKLLELVCPELEKGNRVFLTIKSNDHDID